jgi:hypothetical protein
MFHHCFQSIHTKHTTWYKACCNVITYWCRSKWLVELSFINLQKGPVTTDDKIAIARIFETIQSFCNFLYEGNESCKSTLEKLSDIILSVVNRRLVDHLDSGSAVSITEEDRLRLGFLFYPLSSPASFSHSNTRMVSQRCIPFSFYGIIKITKKMFCRKFRSLTLSCP